MDKLVQYLSERGLTISSAESLTGGLFATKLTSVSGASKVFKGSIVSYSTEVKIDVLNVPVEIIEKYGVISNECAEYMCENVAKIMKSDIAVSFTGNAGPNAMDGKPVGTVSIGVYRDGKAVAFTFELSGSRDDIREECIEIALYRILNSSF